MDKPKQLSYKELTRGDWLATRGYEVFERIEEYQTRLAERIRRATTALEANNIPYAIVGGNAVAAWVASADPSAVRHTNDVDILIQRQDLDRVKAALEPEGFIYKHVASLDFFIDGANGSAREGLHLIFAGEKVKPEYTVPAPSINEIERSIRGYFITTLEGIVNMKLTSNRRKDQVHIDDMLSVGLINADWLDKLPPELAERLQYLLDNPED